MPQGLKIVCSIILQGSRLRRTGGTPNDTDVVNGLHTIFETGLKVFALGNLKNPILFFQQDHPHLISFQRYVSFDPLSCI